MNGRRLYLETFLISLAVILLEVSYTRVFSFKLVYYFTYLIIGIALLGLGAGGVFVAIFPRFRRLLPSRLIPGCCLVAAAAVLFGYLVVAQLQLNLFHLIGSLVQHAYGTSLREAAKLTVICLALFTPFFAAGLALATIFATQTERINRLYFADLLGAGLGCAVCVPLIVHVSPPGTVMLAGFCFALAGLRLAAVDFRPLVAPIAMLAPVLLLGAAFPTRLPDPIPDTVKMMAPTQFGPRRPVFSQWSPVFRVDVLPVPDPSLQFLTHDGTLGSSIRRFDGNLALLTWYEKDERSYPFRLLRSSPTVAIVGAAGGNEILASLYFRAAHVTAIELNPVTVSLLTTHFADYTGHLAENPRVTLVNGEGRSFFKRHREQYDLIWFVAPDSYASMNAATSGSFVLSESYLYTTEMALEALDHLAPGGLICTQFGEMKFDEKPNRTARYVATAREAFRRRGIEDFDRHVLVATSAGFEWGLTSTILLKKEPFSEADVRRFAENTTRLKGGVIRLAWNQSNGDGPVNKVASLRGPDLAEWYEEYPFDVRPVTDDSPFFWHFVSMRDATLGSLTRALDNPEEGMGERVLLVLLCVATGFAALFLLTPLLAIRSIWRAIPFKGHAAIYFGALGLGFMFLEVSLIQRLTLFLGYPTYSLTVTLFALLGSTGLGSLLSERYRAERNRLLLGLAVGLTVLVVFYLEGITPIVSRAVGWPLALRATLAISLLTPLGLCLGAFMPLGLRTIAGLTPYHEEFVAWGWAVNGFFSVVSSVLATILSMTIGFSLVMVSALAVYLVGIAALMRVPSPAQAQRT